MSNSEKSLKALENELRDNQSSVIVTDNTIREMIELPDEWKFHPSLGPSAEITGMATSTHKNGNRKILVKVLLVSNFDQELDDFVVETYVNGKTPDEILSIPFRAIAAVTKAAKLLHEDYVRKQHLTAHF